MALRFLIPAMIGLLLLPAVLIAGDDDTLVRRLDAVPGPTIFEAASRNEPAQIGSAEDAAEYFDAAQLALLNEQVDWDETSLLIFAWRGSGQDRMTAQTEDDTVRFVYTPGRTRDLRPHVYVFAVQQGVVWEVVSERPGR